MNSDTVIFDNNNHDIFINFIKINADFKIKGDSNY